MYGPGRLLALFTTIFQTARTLYFLWVLDGYAKAGAQSLRRGSSAPSLLASLLPGPPPAPPKSVPKAPGLHLWLQNHYSAVPL